MGYIVNIQDNMFVIKLKDLDLSDRVLKYNVDKKLMAIIPSSSFIVSEVSSMDSNQLTLPNFSDFVIPYLQGENLCSKLKNTMRNIIIETLIEFLDKNNMLTGKSKIQQALGYKALGRRLLLKYPKIHREDCTSKRRRKEELDFKLENFKTMDKLVEALYMTKDTRSNYALETIPEYLLHSKAIFIERVDQL
ncbi:hypothetical protein Avbf_15291 [Armadillidium vulgare]|nr:hypothetical protein Avbf_15291 [Armadillidium vulgare]